MATVRVLDLDGSVLRQTEVVSAFNPSVISLREVGARARLWANAAQAASIRNALDPASRDAITLFGSGDYHYVSALLLEQFRDALSVIVFDHHPDWDRLPPRRGCGAWVSRALELKPVKQILLVGNASDDLILPSALTGNLEGVRNGRLAMLPYEIENSSRWPWRGRTPPMLKEDPIAVFEAALQRLPTTDVYVSIDKDCLTSRYALTNWEEGRLTLELLLALLAKVREHRNIVGLDITGEYTAETIPSPWKSWCSRIDHPRYPTAHGHSAEEIDRVNGLTNRRLLEALTA